MLIKIFGKIFFKFCGGKRYKITQKSNFDPIPPFAFLCLDPYLFNTYQQDEGLAQTGLIMRIDLI